MGQGVKAKHQRLILILFALLMLIGAALLAANALRDQAAYFYTPTTLNSSKIEEGKAVRLGGMVKHGSIEKSPDGTSVQFTVQDKNSQILVNYSGILPDLFVEGSGVVAEGRLNAQGQFVADSLLARHDENYVPRELGDMDQYQAEHSKDSVVE
ncbi:cytochrome c biogenesis protein CcmE [Sphingorhabdus lutea]|uniref:Cytochrome c-type biogenesis protein CcmE n=1 Tax=Sphingorhabdus lutea TaxID=1913578 RepID=A0A1L3JF36_9SPHN|nr:cytochrome c maturation protein CcmE [Sphingorhabdus lutea]APG63742.1 cytochrome c biogenesis protein CcmE [Sphingorhabdus lutea]